MPKRKTIHQRSSAKRLFRILIALFLVILVSLIYIIFFSPLFRVSKIILSNQPNCVDPSEVKRMTNLLDKWIFTVKNNFSGDITKKYLCVSSVTLKKTLPNQVDIGLVERRPLAVIKILKTEASASALLDFSQLNSDKELLVDQNGVIYKEGSQSGLPILFVSGDINLGDSLAGSLLKNAITVLDNLKVLGINDFSAKIMDNDLVINSNPKLLISLNRDTKSQLASLQLILEEAKIEDVAMEFVDLRFDTPVVKYVSKKGAQ